MRRFRTAAVTGLLLVPIVAGGFFLQEPPVQASARLLDQVLQLVSNQYVDTLSTGQLYQKAAHGLVRELNDPYSELLDPRASDEFERGTGGRYGGTGMLIEDQQGTIVVSRVFPHTPAEEAGVQEGDRIVEIDGQAVRGWTLTKVSESLRGVPGTQVRVTYARPTVTEPIRLRFTRRVVHVPAVLYSTSFDGVGYIPLQTFNENAAEELTTAVNQLLAGGATGIIVDLRENGGGIVEQSLAISSLFLKEGDEIVSVRSRSDSRSSRAIETARAEGPHIAPGVPLVVLVDRNSASASEIVAGALQDHDRALVIGETTFGKGLVQSLFRLDGGYALKLTTGKWFTPSGRTIHRDRRVVGGRFVESDTAADTLSRAQRPTFRSTGGRTLYGGGGITPDVTVKEDTLPTIEQEFLRALAPKAQVVQTVLSRYALELKPQVRPDFRPDPAWTTEVLRRLNAEGVTVDQRFQAVAPTVLARELEFRVARTAFGDAAAKRRELVRDRALQEALRLLRGRRTQGEVFTAAGTPLARR